jgi:beta-lactamase class A
MNHLHVGRHEFSGIDPTDAIVVAEVQSLDATDLGESGIMKRAGVIAIVALVVVGAWLAFGRAIPVPFGQADSTHVGEPAGDSLAGRSVPERADTLLEARLRDIASHTRGRCAIAATNLRTGQVARVNAATAIPLMSVVKVPVALVVLDGVDHGRWSMTTPVTLVAQDMHPRGWLGDRFPRGGGPVKLYTLLTAMLTRSDNSAADALMRLVDGPPAVTRWLEQHGIRDLRVDRTERGLGDDWYGLASGADTMGSAEDIRELRSRVPDAVQDSAVQAMLLDPRDTGTADACVHLLERLWRGELLSAAMTDTLKSVLARCKTAPHRLPAMLPRGTPVARKTGTGGMWRGVTVAINDVGVIRLPNGDDVAIAVLIGEPRGPVVRTERVIARIARAVYDAWSTELSAASP